MNIQIDAVRRRVSLDPRDPTFFNDPYPAYRAIREAAPTFFWEQYGFWCFSRHGEVSSLLRDRRFGRQILHLTSRAQLGWSEPPAHLKPFFDLERHSLLELEPPEHTRLRNLVNRAFVSRQVERLAPRIAALTNKLIDGFVAQGSANLLDVLATPIPVIVIAELLGVPAEMWPRLLDWSHCMVAMYQFGVSRSVEDGAAAAALEFADFLRAYVEERRRRPGEDLISQLIAAQSEGGRLNEDELIATCVLLLNAGHEATVHAIGNGVKALLEGPAAARSALAVDGARASLIEELLRYDAPLHLFTRFVLEDLKFEGVAFKKGERIGLLLGAANRDPERFPDPDRIEAARTPNPHVSFGGGIHFCIGAPLARLELATVLPIIVDRLPNLELAAPARYRDSFHFHGLEALWARWRA
jgi:cytochrome P450